MEELASEWSAGVDFLSIDPLILEIEAANLEKRHRRYHVPRVGNLQKERPDGVFRWFYSQLGGTSTLDVRDRKQGLMADTIQEWDCQGGALLEHGVNFDSYPASQNLASWFKDDFPCISATCHNKHAAFGQRHIQGGCGLLACKELRQYVRSKCADFRDLGRFLSWRIFANTNHVTRGWYFGTSARPSPSGSEPSTSST